MIKETEKELNDICDDLEVLGTLEMREELIGLPLSEWLYESELLKMKEIRKFEKVTRKELNDKEIILPTRGTLGSAGYDISIYEDVIIKPGETKIIPTGLKVKMPQNEFLQIVPRSSIGIKRKIRITNTMGVIDSDYYNNPDNEGEIHLPIHNFGKITQKFSAGDRLAQGIFIQYLITGDEVYTLRKGGIGSTDE